MNASEEPRGSSRVEREVLEILERSEASRTPVEQIQTAVRKQSDSARAQLSRTAAGDGFLARIPGDIARLGGALLLAIAAVVVSDFSRLLGVLLAIVSAVVFFSLWLPSRPSGPGSAPRWRGRDLSDDGPPHIGSDRPERGPRLPRR